MLPTAKPLRGDPPKLVLTDATRAAFWEIKLASAKTTLLTYTNSSTMLSQFVDASNYASGEGCNSWFATYVNAMVPQKLNTASQVGNCWQNTALLPNIQAVKGRYFVMFTDHKPLT